MPSRLVASPALSQALTLTPTCGWPLPDHDGAAPKLHQDPQIERAAETFPGRHGRCLQSLDPSDSRRLEGRFVFDFSGRLTDVETEEDETEVEYVVSLSADRSLDWRDLLEAVGVDPVGMSGRVGQQINWTVPSLTEAEEQVAAMRKVLPAGATATASAVEHDRDGTRELGWSVS